MINPTRVHEGNSLIAEGDGGCDMELAFWQVTKSLISVKIELNSGPGIRWGAIIFSALTVRWVWLNLS